MLENPDVIAIDQDSLGVQGSVLSQSGSGQVWVKPLANGDRAVALFNRGLTPMQISTTATAVGLPQTGAYRLLDVWTGGSTFTTGDISANVPPETVVLFRGTALQPPSVAISSPPARSPFVRGQKVQTTFSCSDGAGAPGIASCTDSNGASSPHGALDTSTAGTHSYSVTATSIDGVRETASMTYPVVKASIDTWWARYRRDQTKIKLTCTGPAGAACRGNLVLTRQEGFTVVRRVHGHRRRLHLYRTIVLGHARYNLGAGLHELVSVRLRQVSGTIRVQGTAAIQDITSAAHGITLVPAPEPRARKRR